MLVELDPAETSHLKSTLRLKEGDRCRVTDGLGNEAVAQVKSFSAAGKCSLEIERMESGSEESSNPGLVLNLYVGIPQRGKMDTLVEKAQELGVRRLQPLETERSVVKMAEAQKAKVLLRWQKIAREAAKQSGVSRLVHVDRPVGFREALGQIGAGETGVLFHPDEGAIAYKDWIRSWQEESKGAKGGPGPLHFFIGPEGGFTDGEVRMALAGNLKKVHLGGTLLKVDTAFLAVVAVMKLVGE
jgi:16S rRNA (uracil1498-N3)-methyltransferase